MKKKLSEDKAGREYWGELSKVISNPEETKNKRVDTTDIELEFLKKYCDQSTTILDLGSGSGLIINKLLPSVKSITAVEKFEGFSKFISTDPNMLVINADLIGFKIRKEYNIVLCTGVGQCFPRNEMKDIYSNIVDMLDDKGYFISRMHCGIKEDVMVEGFSEELGTDYFAEFRSVDKEVELIKEVGFSEVELVDFLPDSINVWDNTRHYYFICKK